MKFSGSLGTEIYSELRSSYLPNENWSGSKLMFSPIQEN